MTTGTDTTTAFLHCWRTEIRFGSILKVSATRWSCCWAISNGFSRRWETGAATVLTRSLLESAANDESSGGEYKPTRAGYRIVNGTTASLDEPCPVGYAVRRSRYLPGSSVSPFASRPVRPKANLPGRRSRSCARMPRLLPSLPRRRRTSSETGSSWPPDAIRPAWNERTAGAVSDGSEERLESRIDESSSSLRGRTVISQGTRIAVLPSG